MDISEKARAYDEALERAKKLQETCDSNTVVDWCEYLFPELKSKDERIKEILIEHIKDQDTNFGIKKWYGFTTEDLIAWLEKQVPEPNWCHHKVDLSNCSEEYRKAYYDGWNNCNQQHSQCKSDLDDVVKCLINGMKFYYEDNEEATWGTDKWSMPVKHIIEVLEKQGNEKKDFRDRYKEVAKSDWFKKSHEDMSCGMITDENECKPKFEVGDFIISDYVFGKIVSVTDDAYLLDTGMGIPFSSQENMHIWTIEDAKDGDVLYSLDSKQPFLYKERPQFSQARGYCCINKFGEFAVWDTSKCVICADKYIPATKEQRDLLFSKMKEAGYEWDAEKKELKLLISNGGDFDTKNCEQNPAWSEEDEDMAGRIRDALRGTRYNYYYKDSIEMIDWLKSLKDRLKGE